MDQMEKSVLVTGAAVRVGRAIAADFAERGFKIGLHYYSSEKEAEVTALHLKKLGSPQVEPIRADLRNSSEIETMVEKAAARLGGLNCVVCSAAVFRRTPWDKITEDDWDYHMTANLKSVFLLVRAVVPHMKENSSIVTIADWAAERPYRNYLPYCVSKAGVIALTRGLAQELAPKIRVNTVSPGTVMPPEHVSDKVIETIRSRIPLERIGTPQDVVASVRFLSDKTSFATGTNLIIDGGRTVADPGYG